MKPDDGPGGGPSTHLARDSLVVGGATVLSRILGFVRDILIARMLGAGPVADAFLVAFRLPNLFRRVLGEGGLNAAFVPVYLSVREDKGADGAKRFAGEAVSVFALGLLTLLALTELLAPWLVLALAGGFQSAPVTLALAESYTRLALPFLAFTIFASLLAAILNAERRFAIAALAPVVLNIVMISALAYTEMVHAQPQRAAKILATAVSLSGIAHLAVVGLALASGRPGWPRPRLAWSPELTRLFTLALPALVAASTSQLVLLVATQIASVQPGAVSWLYYADRVFQLPLGFVAVAMGVVLLPEIAAREAAGDAAGRRATVNRALKVGLMLAIPAAVALMAIAEPIVSVLFERGKFGPDDRIATAGALTAFAAGLPLAVTAKVLTQVYFARQEPRYPLMAGLLSLFCALLVGRTLAPGMPATGAAMAASMAFLIQSLTLGLLLARHRLWTPDRAMVRIVMQLALASAVMAAALWFSSGMMWHFLVAHPSTLSGISALAALCAGGIGVFFLAAFAFGALARSDLDAIGARGRGSD
jgi:putative peptidoglycan lipid II flippase